MLKEHKIIGLMQEFEGLKLETLDDRIMYQKSIYFLQRFGAKTSYTYSWYLLGPYSPDLSTAAFLFENILNSQKLQELAKDSLTEEDREAVRRFKEFKEEIQDLPGTITIERKLELLASLDFLAPNNPNNDQKSNIEQRIKSKKPYLELKNPERYWELLEKHGLK